MCICIKYVKVITGPEQSNMFSACASVPTISRKSVNLGHVKRRGMARSLDTYLWPPSNLYWHVYLNKGTTLLDR